MDCAYRDGILATRISFTFAYWLKIYLLRSPFWVVGMAAIAAHL
jgi:hypothetical protein